MAGKHKADVFIYILFYSMICIQDVRMQQPLEILLKSENTPHIEFYADSTAQDHNTLKYQQVKAGTAVFRRAASFYLGIGFNREYDPAQDNIRLVFTTGNTENPEESYRAVVAVNPKSEKFPQDPAEWQAEIDDRDRKTPVLSINIPPSAPIGEWLCVVQTYIADDRSNYASTELPKFYVLFNPWAELDGVYMGSEEDKAEYVLNEDGVIWHGSGRYPRGLDWKFEQFSDIALPTALYLLEKAALPASKRGDPVEVARTISQIVNTDDDNGLLVERHDGSYPHGTAPLDGAASSQILYQYKSNRGTPVRYGHCLVYSAVTVTICRALGIPCRSVTKYLSTNDEGDSSPNDIDSCSNFHSWNEVWMTRPDLRPEFNGWQAIDGTPLRRSDNIMRCGPAPVAAIKSGELKASYDTKRVFYDVNSIARRRRRSYESEGTNLIVDSSESKIVTKGLSVQEYVDITANYKNSSTDPDRELIFDLVKLDSLPLGDEFDVVVLVQNNAAEERTISISVAAINLPGRIEPGFPIKDITGEDRLPPGTTRALGMRVLFSEYFSSQIEFIKMVAKVSVVETGLSWQEEDIFYIDSLRATLSAQPGQVNEGETANITFSFQNPLNRPLTKASYIVEGPTEQLRFSQRYRDIEPNELVNIEDSIVVTKRGRRSITIKFVSEEIPEIPGTTYIVVE